MENINIEGHRGTYYVPTVNFNAETGICELEGESYLEDTASFFNPLISWLNDFFKYQDIKLTFNFKLNYYNTSSSKCIVDIFNLLKKKSDRGKNVEVNWFYNSFSEDAEEEVEEVEDFMLETGLDINLVPYQE